jgi:propanol-preferring alcohol dehydrogenase
VLVTLEGAMRAMVLTAPGPIGPGRLELRDLPVPRPGTGQALVEVAVNAVCRTDLHVVEGELGPVKPALVVGTVKALGEDVDAVAVGDRVGVPWLGGTCGRCRFCRAGRENLCEQPSFTGYQVDGGYAEYALVRADFALPVPDAYGDVEAAPLLCAGLIGYRALRLAAVEPLSGPGRLGLFGFGSSAHIVIQVARHLGHEVYAYTRGEASRRLSLELGAAWAGGGEERPPVELDSVIVFAPVGELVPVALRAVRKGGRVVLAGIHMTPIPSFEYELIWGERSLQSVANLTRQDGREFLELAPRVPIEIETHTYPLERANEALAAVEEGDFRGSAVLIP